MRRTNAEEGARQVHRVQRGLHQGRPAQFGVEGKWGREQEYKTTYFVNFTYLTLEE